VLVPSSLSHEQALKFVFVKLGLSFSDDNFFSRCVVCNSKVVNLEIEEARKFQDFPWEIEEVEGSEALKFFHCSECKKIYWWGPKSYFTIDDLKKMISSYSAEDEKTDHSSPEISACISDRDIKSSHEVC
jgi:uncharacterized protein with PIN domain